MHSDYTELDRPSYAPRSDEDWNDVWKTTDRNHDTLRKIALGLAAIATASALLLIRAGWVRMSTQPEHIIPSAADIHVRMPPPR